MAAELEKQQAEKDKLPEKRRYTVTKKIDGSKLAALEKLTGGNIMGAPMPIGHKSTKIAEDV